MAGQDRAKRFSRRIKVSFRMLGEERDTSGYTTDISSTGMFIATNRHLKPGTRLRLEVADRRRSFVVEGIVMRQRRVPPQLQRVEPGGLGVRFLLVSELIQELLPNEDVTEGDTERLRVPTDAALGKALKGATPKKRIFRLKYSRAGQFIHTAKQALDTGGMFIRTQRSGRTSINEQIAVELTPPGHDAMTFDAKIVHIVEPSESEDENLMAGVGVEFLDRAGTDKTLKAALEKLGL